MIHLPLETARSAHCVPRYKSFHEPQTSRNSGAVSEAFLGVVYGER